VFITNFQLSERPSLRDELRTALARINHGVKQCTAPAFKVEGSVKRAVRLRKPAFNAAGPFGMHTLAGGEDFRIDNMIVNEHGHLAGVEIVVTFCPVQPALARKVASMTMPLDQAFQVLPGLEAWCELSFFKGTQQAHDDAQLARLPTAAQVFASAAWGVW